MIAILFFNWYGYRIVTGILADNADQQLEARLDNNQYDEASLIEVKVPLNMPYQNEQADFERHYGEMDFNGQHLTYVKRKIENGYLVLKCIPNHSRQKIEAAGNDYFKLANGLDQDHPGKKQDNTSSFAKNFWSEYDGRETDFSVAVAADLVNRTYLNTTASLYSISLPSMEQPPDLLLA